MHFIYYTINVFVFAESSFFLAHRVLAIRVLAKMFVLEPGIYIFVTVEMKFNEKVEMKKCYLMARTFLESFYIKQGYLQCTF